jgi:hypothetical protein
VTAFSGFPPDLRYHQPCYGSCEPGMHYVICAPEEVVFVVVFMVAPVDFMRIEQGLLFNTRAVDTRECKVGKTCSDRRRIA